MTINNITSIEELRELKELRKSQDHYEKYLGTLANSQLETEINFVLDQYSLDSSGKDFFQKVKLIQNEIVSRADADWKDSIQRLNNPDLI